MATSRASMSGVTNPVYRFSELSESTESNNGAAMSSKGNGRESGCHVTTATGFVLVLLTVLLAVGVGLIVHFAEKNSFDRDITCTFPENVLAQLLGQTQGQGQGQGEGTTSAPERPGSSHAPGRSPTAKPTLSPALSPSLNPTSRSRRLPRNLVPLYYDLEIQPDLYGNDPETFKFNGSVVVHFRCDEATDKIVLNAKNLSVSDVAVEDSSGRSITVASVNLDDAAETLTINLSSEMMNGMQYSTAMKFEGPLTDDLAGLYLSSYKRGEETVYLATTQFESPDAREAFPCFDEPAMKAHFNVTIVRKEPKISLSNTQIVTSQERGNGWIADVYGTTPKMSTYLLAFIVCDFEKVNGTTSKGVEFEVWLRKELIDQAQFALEAGMKVLDYYGSFFGTDFPLKKQAMIGIPDFANGAMENWGLVTYRESYMTYQKGVTSETTRNYNALVIAHELAHQWFGNLVTMAWWDDLWLNEGFAEFVEYIGMDLIDGSWKVWEQFVVDTLQESFLLDQLATSHPLYTEVKAVEDADQYFDNISYLKGASVIRMLQFVLGKATFQRGLQRYLSEHAYGNANHADLWNALDEQLKNESRTLGDGYSVADVMNTWTLQMGFPVMKVTQHGNNVMVTQKRFLINPDAKDPGTFQSQYGYKWYVPVTLASSEAPDFNLTEDHVLWLSKDEEHKTLSNARVQLPAASDQDGWVLANVQQYGYYRVNYEPQNWQAIIRQLQKDHTVIPPINRAQIIDDVFNLASAGETEIDIALGTLQYLDAERDYIPWRAASTQIAILRRHMVHSSRYGAINRFVQDRSRKVFNMFGLDDTNATALDSYTRSTVASLACGSGLRECVTQATQLFKRWRDNPDDNPISSALRAQVYCTAIREGDESDWYFVLTQYRKETSPTQKNYLLRSLACSKSVWILSTLLEMSLEADDVKRDDATGMIGWVGVNPVGTRLAWDFMRVNWQTIMRDFSQSASRLKYMVDSVATRFHEEFHLQEFRDFIESLGDLGSAEQALRNAVETIEFNIKWYRNSYPKIEEWLDNKGYGEFEGSGTAEQKVTKEDILLPTDIRPLHYDLVIEPLMYGDDPEDFTFNGTLTMTFTCVKETNQIVMHAHELEVTDIKMVNSPRAVTSDRMDTEKQFLIITLDGQLTPGRNYSVSMNFEGQLENDRDGLYLSSYKNGNETRYLATTQFESVAARKAFPCMDEPQLKATFSTTIVRRRGYTALSNMPVKNTTDLGGDRMADEFEISLPMSTYLVALIVCDFVHDTSYTQTRNITYEVWGRPSAKDQLGFALETGVKVIDYFEVYFDVPFPLPKQSMIGIPDFTAGAMENWGLITYRETRILVEEGVSSLLDKEATAMTIAHELAHMWFGDLVSPAWWDDIWLNEGFARFMQYLGVDHIKPEWKEWDLFVTTVVHQGMRLDGYVSSHPIFVPVATPDEINEVFDSISYDKGASIIRMIRHAIGYDTFKKGITNYLNALRYKNANHTDLWNYLNQQAEDDNQDVNVGDVMDTWTLQMNYPVVTVKVEGSNLLVSQQRFLKDPTAKELGRYTSPFGYKWDIPFTFTTFTEANFNETAVDIHWIMKTETNKTISLNGQLSSGEWVVANIKEVGYYRVNYDEENWRKLAEQLKTNHTVIDVVNRAQIINDAWNLAGGGYLDQSVALSVVDYLDKETEYIPWRAASTELGYVSTMLVATELFGPWEKFLANKSAPLYHQLGINNTETDLLKSLIRTRIVSQACGSGVKECVDNATDLFKQWRQNPDNNPISPEVRPTVYCVSIVHGSVADWDFLYEQYVKEENVNEKRRLMLELTCSKRIWVLSRLLNRALFSEDIRHQDSMYVIINVLSNSVGRALAWRFFRENWNIFFERYGTETFTLANFASAVGDLFNTEIELQELQDFVSSHPNLGTATRAFQTAIESVRSNVRWMDKHYGTFKNWLEKQGYYEP